MAISLSLFKNGDLDDVMKHKSEEDSAMTEKEYKAYYEKGYKTDISSINIKGDNITFEKMGRRLLERINMLVKNLDYKKGNRGVRFIFKLTNDDTRNYLSTFSLVIIISHLRKQNTSTFLWVTTMKHYLKKWIIGQRIILFIR